MIQKKFLTLGFFCALIAGIGLMSSLQVKSAHMISKNIKSIEDVKQIFPQTADQITKESDLFIQEAQEQLESVLAIPAQQRTFANTAQALDELESLSNIAIKYSAIELTTYLHPDEAMRKAAQEASQKIKEFYIDLAANKKLYEAFKSYAQGAAHTESLNAEQQYFIDETMKSFKRAGLHLPDDQLEEVKKIKKELAQCSQDFEKNISQDARTISVTKEGLVGLDGEFIDTLKKTDEGKFILGVDYPTYFRVMQHCGVEDTRKRLYEAFMNRAYPANTQLLKKIIALRDQLAKKLGYASYAHLDLESQMVQSPDRAEAFLTELNSRAKQKEIKDFALLSADLPESVTLTKDGKIKAWDYSFLSSHYKKKHFDLDEQKLAEYFPMESTIAGLLDIYRAFLGVEFKEVPVSGLWHEDVQLIQVYSAQGDMLGYLFLDLHPRPNKYSHAAHANVVPGVQLGNGKRTPTVSVLMCNFPRATKDKPALFTRSDVNTFFHEFGHALHSLLGATHMGSFAGTNVKRDFVELPSQMLEEWLHDKEILTKISKHYKTGQPLAQDVIDKIIALKQFGTGQFVRRQCMLSCIALNCFKEGQAKDPDAIENALYAEFQPNIEFGGNRHQHASFGHLTGYAAKYYGYMWSKVFALDLFDTIAQQGLLNPAIGKKYVAEVIGRGGSCDPNELLKNFLGREANANAFYRDLGFH